MSSVQQTQRPRANKRGNNEGTVYQEAAGRWRGSVSLANGKRRYLSGKTREDVAKKLTHTLADLDGGIEPAHGRETVLAWLTHYVDDLEARGLTRNTITRYRGILVRYLGPALGKVKLAQLQPAHVQRYQTDMLKQGVPGKTLALHRAILGGALKQAAAFGMLPRNVVTLVKPPRAAKDGKGTMLTPDRARALAEHVQGDRLEAFYLVCLTAGLRRGEALGLRWPDLEIDGPGPWSLHVRQQLQWPDGQPTLVPVKSRKGLRSIPLPFMTAEALRVRRQLQAIEREVIGETSWTADGLVFNSERGAPLHRNTITAQFRTHLKSVGLKSIRLHDLRHTYGSLLMSRGVPLKTISELLGHASISLTGDVYLHALDADLRDTAGVMENALSGAGELAVAAGRCPTCGQPVPAERP